MMGQMGAADYNFGGKTWSSFYYVQQVNFKGTLANGNVLQSWIQFQDWDQTTNASATVRSFMNLQCQVTVGTTNTFVDTVSCGSNDLLTLAGGPTATRGQVACPVVGSFVNRNDVYTVSNGWTSFACSAQRFFNEPAGTITQLKAGDTISFKSGFKMFPAASATAATVQSSTTPTIMTWTVVDGSSSLALSLAASLLVLTIF